MRIALETGEPVAVVARESGINEGTLGNWCASKRRARERSNGALSENERGELVRLRQQVAELQVQRDALMRSVALGAKESMGRSARPPSTLQLPRA